MSPIAPFLAPMVSTHIFFKERTKKVWSGCSSWMVVIFVSNSSALRQLYTDGLLIIRYERYIVTVCELSENMALQLSKAFSMSPFNSCTLPLKLESRSREGESCIN